jgi:hypothetical protein
MRLSRAQFEALFEGLDWRRITVPLVQVTRPKRLGSVTTAALRTTIHWP